MIGDGRAAGGPVPAGRSKASAPAARQNDGPLDHVAQFADVAGPVVCCSCSIPARVRRGWGQPRIFGRQFDEMLNQQRHILLPLAQGRNLHGKDIQAVKQIFRKPARRRPPFSSPGWWPPRCARRPGACGLRPRALIGASPATPAAASPCISAAVLPPISSRNSVPPSAVSKRPARSLIAPVNAPWRGQKTRFHTAPWESRRS